jgi:hypothetical protein
VAAHCITDPACAQELLTLQQENPQEYASVLRAIAKLDAMTGSLGYPHASAVRGSTVALRELRPRRGRSPWRVLYAPGRPPVLLALAPEARRDPRGFRRAVVVARDRARKWTLP